MTTDATTSKSRSELVCELLWDYLPPSVEHLDRKRTGWGTKTKLGLLLSVQSALLGNPPGLMVTAPQREQLNLLHTRALALAAESEVEEYLDSGDALDFIQYTEGVLASILGRAEEWDYDNG